MLKISCLKHSRTLPTRTYYNTPQPSKEPSVEGSETLAADTTLDRATAMEDCSRLALEAEQSLPVAQTVGEALAVLTSTLSVASSDTPPQVVTTVSSEVASAVVEAEELVDDLLSVIQVSYHVITMGWRFGWSTPTRNVDRSLVT